MRKVAGRSLEVFAPTIVSPAVALEWKDQRDAQVIEMLLSGASRRKIAEATEISYDTVIRIIDRYLSAFRIASAAEALRQNTMDAPNRLARNKPSR